MAQTMRFTCPQCENVELLEAICPNCKGENFNWIIKDATQGIKGKGVHCDHCNWIVPEQNCSKCDHQIPMIEDFVDPYNLTGCLGAIAKVVEFYARWFT